MDQLAEMYNAISPFAYVGNNPINMFDPDGRKITPISMIIIVIEVVVNCFQKLLSS
ncbi:hypothetical protein GCM10022217_13370 [Chryseobacterium ginsenosidimutans]